MVPPEQTNAEAYYYLKQMQSKTPIVVRLVDGEELRGWIEWYDKDVIKLNREHGPEPAHSEALHQVPLQGRGGAHAQEETPPARDALVRGRCRRPG